jgi:pyruvate/2-oxoacid:ferredoxin oxidoreductase beta subunit/sulfite reductase alpha subunit-like flavoprotein
VLDTFKRTPIVALLGDGAACDADLNGVLTLLGSHEDVNIIVFDNELYANTGGQRTQSTPAGVKAKFGHTQEERKKQSLSLNALATFPEAFVSSVALLANPQHTIDAIWKGITFQGPSLITCYTPCVEHGIKGGMAFSGDATRDAVASGHWPLFIRNPSENGGRVSVSSKRPSFSSLSPSSLSVSLTSRTVSQQRGIEDGDDIRERYGRFESLVQHYENAAKRKESEAQRQPQPQCASSGKGCNFCASLSSCAVGGDQLISNKNTGTTRTVPEGGHGEKQTKPILPQEKGRGGGGGEQESEEKDKKESYGGRQEGSKEQQHLSKTLTVPVDEEGRRKATPVCVVFGRRGGASERRAREVAHALLALGVKSFLVNTSPVLSLVNDDHKNNAVPSSSSSPSTLPVLLDREGARTVVFTLPTYGTGSLPNGIADLEDTMREWGKANQVTFSVCAMGTSAFREPNFCAAGKKVERLLRSLGAWQVGKTMIHDQKKVTDADFASWVHHTIPEIASAVITTTAVGKRGDIVCTMKDKEQLEESVSEKEKEKKIVFKFVVRGEEQKKGKGGGDLLPFAPQIITLPHPPHTVLRSVPSSHNGVLTTLSCEAKDEAEGKIAFGSIALVYPTLPEASFTAVIRAYKGRHGPDDLILTKGDDSLPTQMTVRQYLTQVIDLHSPPTPELLAALQKLNPSFTPEQAQLRVADNLIRCENLPSLDELASLVGRIEPRAYSVSGIREGEIDLCVGLVFLPDQTQPGLASNFIVNLKEGDSVPVSFLPPPSKVAFPGMDSALILVGLGTGYAPVRLGLLERAKMFNKAEKEEREREGKGHTAAFVVCHTLEQLFCKDELIYMAQRGAKLTITTATGFMEGKEAIAEVTRLYENDPGKLYKNKRQPDNLDYTGTSIHICVGRVALRKSFEKQRKLLEECAASKVGPTLMWCGATSVNGIDVVREATKIEFPSEMFADFSYTY